MQKLLAIFVVFIVRITLYAQSPAGDIKGPFTLKSDIYPGTEREYWLYVPKLYDASKPACTMIVQDGLSRATEWKLPTVLDSMIAHHELPVIIGIFVDHGKVASAGKDNYPRYNRSFEFDALGDRYAKFLTEELLPEVSKSYNISKNPNDRSIAGASSGAIAAFNAAWERPEQFRRVLSTIGTYVGLRGGDELATLVRKSEPKPIRVFLADGTNDLNIYAGDWWTANQGMLTALTWAGYEVNHAWGDGGHDSKHAVTILSGALKWLWKDYPTPVQTHKSPLRRMDPLVENESWKELNINQSKANRLAVNASGEVFFTDNKEIYKIDLRGNVTLFNKVKGLCGGLSFNRDGRLYVADAKQHRIVAIGEKGSLQDIVKNVNADFLTVTSKGIYFTDRVKDQIGFYSFERKSLKYTMLPDHPSGLAVSAEQTFLTINVANSVFGFSLKITDDGTLESLQEYVHYHVPYGATTPDALGMTVDMENLLYTSTNMGIQLSDQLGRVNYIFSNPAEGAGDVKFGGADLKTLYVVHNGKLFSRKIAMKGILSWMDAVKPQKPGL
ncbi:SMP-30/gluconolactonase/LRE family protein [soil metagenome]